MAFESENHLWGEELEARAREIVDSAELTDEMDGLRGENGDVLEEAVLERKKGEVVQICRLIKVLVSVVLAAGLDAQMKEADKESGRILLAVNKELVLVPAFKALMSNVEDAYHKGMTMLLKIVESEGSDFRYLFRLENEPEASGDYIDEENESGIVADLTEFCVAIAEVGSIYESIESLKEMGTERVEKASLQFHNNLKSLRSMEAYANFTQAHIEVALLEQTYKEIIKLLTSGGKKEDVKDAVMVCYLKIAALCNDSLARLHLLLTYLQEDPHTFGKSYVEKIHAILLRCKETLYGLAGLVMGMKLMGMEIEVVAGSDEEDK